MNVVLVSIILTLLTGIFLFYSVHLHNILGLYYSIFFFHFAYVCICCNYVEPNWYVTLANKTKLGNRDVYIVLET
jgi:thiosulfate reductase cytochrome b subunit